MDNMMYKHTLSGTPIAPIKKLLAPPIDTQAGTIQCSFPSGPFLIDAIGFGMSIRRPINTLKRPMKIG